MPFRTFINEIIQEGQKYPENGRIGNLIKILKMQSSNDEHKINEEKIKEELCKENNFSALNQAIEACVSNYMLHPDPLIKNQAETFKNKLDTLKLILKNPVSYFEKLVADGSEKFHSVNAPLQKILFTTESKVTVPSEVKKNTLEIFSQVKEMMQEAAQLLDHPSVIKHLTPDKRDYLQGRIIRRNKEIPIMEHLLYIRLEMNALSQSGIQSLYKTVSDAANAWRPIYFEMQKLREPLLKKEQEKQILSTNERLSLENFGYVGARIDKAINTLDKAFKKSKLITEKDYSLLSDSILSSRSYKVPPTPAVYSKPASILFDSKESIKTSYQMKIDQFKNEFKKYLTPFRKPQENKDDLYMSHQFERRGVDNHAEFLSDFRSPIGLSLISETEDIVRIYKDATHFSYYTKEEFNALKIQDGKRINPETNLPIYKTESVSSNEYREKLLDPFAKHCKEQIYKQFTIEKEQDPSLKKFKIDCIENTLTKMKVLLKKDLGWLEATAVYKP